MLIVIDFKFNEERDVKSIIESCSLCKYSIHKEIWFVTLYMMKIMKTDESILFNEIVAFLSACNRSFNYELYINAIDMCIHKAKKYTFKHIKEIVITRSEMEIIQSFKDIRKEKIAFVVISIAKYTNASYRNEKDVLYAKLSEIFKLARVSIPASERACYFRFMYESNILSKQISIGHFIQKVNVISHNPAEEIVMQLSEDDYKELAYTYLNYKHGGYKRCAECGRWFKPRKKEPARMYCHLHQRDNSIKNDLKECKCADCNRIFYIKSKNNRTYRCKSCQEKQNKIAKTSWNDMHMIYSELSNKI